MRDKKKSGDYYFRTILFCGPFKLTENQDCPDSAGFGHSIDLTTR